MGACTLTDCRHYHKGRCRLNRGGGRPSRGYCRNCITLNGDRIKGPGDRIAWLLSWMPRRVMPKAGCGGCSKRQSWMNRNTDLVWLMLAWLAFVAAIFLWGWLFG